jgi:hypothetical protein
VARSCGDDGAVDGTADSTIERWFDAEFVAYVSIDA